MHLLTQLRKIWERFLHTVDLRVLMVLIAIFYGVSWGIFVLGEGGDSPFADPVTWWYYFWTTASTVGYGDLSPTRPLTRFYAGPFFWFSLLLFGALIAELSSVIAKFYSRRKRGLMPYTGEDHVVIMGYRADLTERLVQGILDDPLWPFRSFVLVDAQLDMVPDIPGADVHFVRGRFHDTETLEKARLDKARRIVCFDRDDANTLAAVAAVQALGPKAHLVVCLDQMDQAKTIHFIAPDAECVMGGMTDMVVQAIQDPGMSRFHMRLLSNLHGQVANRLNLPETAGEMAYGDLLVRFKRTYDATLVGLVPGKGYMADFQENPAWDTVVRGGMGLFYIAPRRLDNEVDWAGLMAGD